MRRRRQLLQVSTFPFLAVLLCAMGSLILLLLVIDRRAKVVARTKALLAAARVADQEAQAAQSKRVEWERRRQQLHQQLVQEDEEVLAEVRAAQAQTDALAQTLQAKQVQASDEGARLRAEQTRLAEWEERLAARRAETARADKETNASQAELARLTAELHQMEQTLADLKALRQRQQQMYSVVPYRGKHGDKRRPLYIECTADGLVFHPDHLILRDIKRVPEELRAEIERRLASHPEQKAGGEQTPEETPYLLMLVRPEGITTYYRALAALKDLKIDFGYEFIDRDWILDFSEDRAPFPTQSPVVAARSEEGSRVPRSPGGLAHASTGGATPMGYRGARFVAGAGDTSAEEAPPWRAGQAVFPIHPVGNPPATGGAGLSSAGLGFGGSVGIGHPQPIPPEPTAPPSLAHQDRGSETGGRGPGPEARGSGSGGRGTGRADAVQDSTGSAGASPSRADASPFRGRDPSQSNGALIGDSKFGKGSGGPDGETGSDNTMSRLPGSPSPRIGTGAMNSSDSGSRSAPPGLPGFPTGSTNSSDKTGSSESQTPAAQGAAPTHTRETTEEPGGQKVGSPTDPLARLAPSKPGRAVPLRQRLLNINRDWIIPIECKADTLVISTTGQRVTLRDLARNDKASNPLLEALVQMIARRQTTLRPGEPPYRPMIRFRVWPDGLRSYYAAYPALEALHVPMARENVDPDEAKAAAGGGR